MHNVNSLIMRRSLAIMSLLCSILAIDAEPTWSAPAFYKGLEGPKYSVVRNGTGWELRRYEPASWASTKREAPELDLATGGVSTGGFRTLFSYISGGNKAGTKIEMTAPVLTKIEPGQGPTCNSTFTISFYNPYKFQGSTAAPQPPNSAIYLNKMPAMDVYVLSFDGFANSTRYQQKVLELIDKLKAAKESFSASYWFTAAYDSPYTLSNRHNEVWVPAASSSGTAAEAAAKPAAATKKTVAPTKAAAASGRKLYRL